MFPTEIYSAFSIKKFQLPISNDILAVTRNISKVISFLLNISHNISHFTYLLTYFYGFREIFSLWQKKKKKKKLPQ